MNTTPVKRGSNRILPLRTIEATPWWELLDGFKAYMREVIGAEPEDEIDTSGTLTRFDTQKSGDLAGWYVCHVTRFGYAATFGDWREQVAHKWTSYQQNSLSRTDKAELKRIQQEQARARDAAKREAREATGQKAREMWKRSFAANPDHPYLTHKQVIPHNLRQRGDLLLLPMTDLDGYLHNIQFIQPDGTKRFLKEGRKKGLFVLVGNGITHPDGVFICEGWATGASLHELYGLPVLCAMDSGNLPPVAQAYRQRFPHIPLTIAADNDRNPDSKGYQIGLKKAREAASMAGATLVYPEFPKTASYAHSDFNDLLVHYGHLFETTGGAS